ncbi:methyltransferase domain-containing protein [Stutzerimonas kunmingensis]|uniref:methyltransferase domain-containing protein n=1 Tax=Stutzerimonas kunmingensis TaxID=1211807 RepID=UPI0028AB8AD0|nr:methyltransferase domain-containing protein [Stutzerimonas kunmingensis]
MLIPNNPDIDFTELNRRITEDVARYRTQKDVRSLPRFTPSAADIPSQPISWEHLVTLENEALIDAAYRFLLGRPADPAGAAHWGEQLNRGIDKFEVLANLRYSPEGKHHAAPTHGLRRARLKALVRRIPVLGNGLFSLYGLARTEARHRMYTARFRQQSEQNLAHDALHRQMSRELDELRQLIENNRHMLQGEIQALPPLLSDCSQRIDQCNHSILQFAENLEQQGSVGKSLDERVQETRMRLARLESTNLSTQTSHGSNEVSNIGQVLNPIPDSFYLALENRFRGDDETIKARLSYYLPMLDECAPLQAGLPAVDIGCGRGEWLKILPERVQRIGIDLNATNVLACHEQGLEALHDDALRWLARQPDASLGLVSAFHVIEHLPFEQLHTLLDQCLRVLAPGGMIMLETPNPENLISAATHFYTDPTHIHPLPPAFTEFLVQYKGFQNTRLHRLNPIPREYALDEDSEVARRCDALFYGPQDYAVTAFKGQV